jgi:peroxiredoxin
MKFLISREWNFVGLVNFKIMEELIMLSIKKIISMATTIAISVTCLLGQNVGDDAPEFSYQSLTGDTVKLSDYQGKVVFLYLFGNGCPSCKSYGNDTETKVQEVYGNRDDFQALGLDLWNSSSSVTTVTAFQSITKITYPLLLKAGDMEQKYTTTYDRLLVIDQEGKLRHKGNTVVSNDLNNAISVIEDLYTTTSTGDLDGANGSPVSGVYPNPVDDDASIRLTLEKEALVDIRIFNLTGQEIINLGKETFQSGSHVREIPAGDLPAGIYLLRTLISGQVYTSKMVVN